MTKKRKAAEDGFKILDSFSLDCEYYNHARGARWSEWSEPPVNRWLTTYADGRILGLYVYPRHKRTIGIAAGHPGPADSSHAHLWITARARDRARHPGNVGARAAGRAWCSVSCTSAPGRTRLDLSEVGSLFKQP